MVQAAYKKVKLKFAIPAMTSRGVMHERITWILILKELDENFSAFGECALLPGLSFDDSLDYPLLMKNLVDQINHSGFPHPDEFEDYPSIRFGLEMALLDFERKGNQILFPSSFTSGEKDIPINGLIWMSNIKEMKAQIKIKLNKGFKVLKLKVSEKAFDDELNLINSLRKDYSKHDLEIRTDANGSFDVNGAIRKLEKLHDSGVHSIEQPIQAGLWDDMAELCSRSSLPIALDEELIGIHDLREKRKILQVIQPRYIILKPTLTGGFAATNEWIEIADDLGVNWWITSALESDIGLNAISQYTATLKTTMVQGLGTGNLFTNNFDSPLEQIADKLHYNPDKNWDLSEIM